jgi:hypothetical protein
MGASPTISMCLAESTYVQHVWRWCVCLPQHVSSGCRRSMCVAAAAGAMLMRLHHYNVCSRISAT